MGKILPFSSKIAASNNIRTVVYVSLPEAPNVLYGETSEYFAVNLNCRDARLLDIPTAFLPQISRSAEELYQRLIPFLHKMKIS